MSKITANTVMFHYIPNMIGYLRVATALISLVLMKSHPKLMTWIYGVSCLLDAFDGAAARRYNQSSRFGAVLDMVTDRCTTASLIAYLCVLYPSWIVLFLILISLDLASHYMHMYSSLASGAKSHKSISENKNLFLRLYYGNRNFLFTCCAFNELFFVGLYLTSFYHEPTIYNFNKPQLLCIVTFPLWLFKQLMNVVQLLSAAVNLAEMDASDKNAELDTKAN